MSENKKKMVHFNDSEWRRNLTKLNEAPMDKKFSKDWERNCKVLITHIDHELKKKDRENFRTLSKLRNYVMDASHVPEQLAKIVGTN